MEKSRHEKRKEVRKSKNQKKYQSWLQHQQSRKLKITSGDLKSKNMKSLNITKGVLQSAYLKKDEVNLEPEEPTLQNKVKVKLGPEESSLLKKVESKSEFIAKHDCTIKKKVKAKKVLKRTQRTKFEEYLEMDKPNAVLSAEEDLKMEKRLAKKLRVKDGKLWGTDVGIDVLFEGIPSVLDSLGKELTSSKKKRKKKSSEQDLEGEMVDGLVFRASEPEESAGVKVTSGEVPEKTSSHKRRKRRKSPQGQEDNMAVDTVVDVSQPVGTNDVEVQLEGASAKDGSIKYVAPHLRSRAGNEPEEHIQIRRRLRGLLNTLSEFNVESITREMSTIYNSVSRNVASRIFNEEILARYSRGLHGNEQYAADSAAFVAGMACLVGMDFSAKFMASLAKTFEGEYCKEDDLSLRNLALLLSYLCLFGVCSSDLIYDFLITLSNRLEEIDVSTISTVLGCCGMKLRGDDPVAMKSFILSIQNRVNELKASAGDGRTKINGKRMEFMLETICDIKNNKMRPKEDSAQHTRIKKWLQKLRVEDVLIRGLKWSKLLDSEKKGQWWLSGDIAAAADDVEEVASKIDKEVLEAQKMLQLAAAQRMNTDARRAIFCIIMSGEDYVDAFEKLLRLDLPGKQDREVMRVLVECCLQEKVFNKYYTVLASKLCKHDKNHKFTLQYCLWDHFKDLESMPLQRSMHLAKFVAEMITTFTLSLTVLKVVDLSDAKQLTPKRIMHFRMLFEAIFKYPDNLIWNVFTRVAVNPDYEALRSGMEFFIKEFVVKANKTATYKFKVAKGALSNMEGVLK